MIKFKLKIFTLKTQPKFIKTKMATPNDFNPEFKNSINHLTKFTQDQPYRILKDRKCYLSLISIGKIIYDHQDQIDFGIFVQNRFDQVISNYLKEIFKIRMEIDFHAELEWENAETYIEENEILFQTFINVHCMDKNLNIHNSTPYCFAMPCLP